MFQTIDIEEIYRLVSKNLNFMAYGSVLNRSTIDFREIFDRFSIDFGWSPGGVSGLLVGVGGYLVDI